MNLGQAAALDELSSGRDLVKQLKDQLEDKVYCACFKCNVCA